MQINVPPYNAAVYVRLSKEDIIAATSKKVESDSISNQKLLILDFLKDKTDINVVSIRVDDGYTGTNFERPAFQLMMDEIRAGKVNCVVVKDLSRFGREYINAGKYIDRLFPYYGVRLISINDNIDTITKSSSDSLNISLKNLMNDNYCRDISIKIRSQLHVKRKNGQFTGAFAPFGYQKSEADHNQLEIDPYAAGIIQDIFLWKIEGMSQDGIARRLNNLGILSPMEYKRSLGENFKTGFNTGQKALWSAVTIRRILTNSIYIGTLTQGIRTRPNYKIKKVIENSEDNWDVVEHTHEPIINKRTFKLVQKLLALDTRASSKEDMVYPLAGLVVCGDCHSPMVRYSSNANGHKYFYYMCDSYRKAKGCYSHRIPCDQLESSVLALLQEHIHLICELDACMNIVKISPFQKISLKKAQERLLKTENEIERYRRLKISLYEDMKDNILTKEDYFDIRNQYDERIEKASLAKEQIQKEISSYLNNTAKPPKWMQDFIEFRNIKELTRIVVVECIEKITVFENKKIEIIFAHSQDFAIIMEQFNEYCNKTQTEVI